MKKKCLIIGGAGFIGYNLTEHLVKSGLQVKVLDKFTDNLRHLESNYNTLRVVNGEVNDTVFLNDHLEDYENIVWLVHSSVPSTSMADIESDLIENTRPLIRFLNFIKTNPNVEKFVYLSSGGTIYGNPPVKEPIEEEQAKQPVSSYGLTKYIAEHYISFILRDSTIKKIIFRPSNVYGVHQNLNKPQGIIGHAFKAAINKHPLILYNQGRAIRDFLYVSDLIQAIHNSLNTDVLKEFSYIYNIGSSEGFSIKQMIDKISDISGFTIETIDKPQRDFDCDYNVLSTKKITEELNWRPTVTLDDGLLRVWNWIKSVN